MMNIILKTYTLKDKRLLISAGALLFWPWGILGFVKDQIDGEYIEKVEWPISEKKQIYIENVESEEVKNYKKYKEIDWETIF